MIPYDKRSSMLDRIERSEDTITKNAADFGALVALIVILAAVLLGCGASHSSLPNDPPLPVPSVEAPVLSLRVESVAAIWLSDPELASNIDRVVEIAKSFWEAETLPEIEIVFTDHVTMGYLGFAQQTRLDPPAWRLEVNPLAPPEHGECLSAITIIHEIGHTVIYDPLHVDPRWERIMDLWWDFFEPACRGSP